jgi:hypothetical protein
MTEKKKRERVVAEITLAHLTQVAQELGRTLNHEEALAFLNQDGRAYAMWKHMMLAGEEYIKTSLTSPRLAAVGRPPRPRHRVSA